MNPSYYGGGDDDMEHHNTHDERHHQQQHRPNDYPSLPPDVGAAVAVAAADADIIHDINNNNSINANNNNNNNANNNNNNANTNNNKNNNDMAEEEGDSKPAAVDRRCLRNHHHHYDDNGNNAKMEHDDDEDNDDDDDFDTFNDHYDKKEKVARCGGLTKQQQQHRVAMLQALQHCDDVVRFWSSLPKKWRHDKEFILAVLKHATTLPPKADFERTFPQSLRQDRDVVLAFCHRPDFPDLYYERLLHVPGCLTADKEVMLAYCQRIPRSLQECSEELSDDRDVVEAAVQLDGLELQYASLRLQEDKNIVVAACQKDGRALEFCPTGPLRTELTSDRQFMLQVLRQQGGPMLRLVAEPLKRDRELIQEALVHGMRFRYCPFEYQTDKSFLQAILERKSALYLEMNGTAQQDPDLALTAIVAQDSCPAVHARALIAVPDLQGDRRVALAIAQRGDLDVFKIQFLQVADTANATTAAVAATAAPGITQQQQQQPHAMMRAEHHLFRFRHFRHDRNQANHDDDNDDPFMMGPMLSWNFPRERDGHHHASNVHRHNPLRNRTNNQHRTAATNNSMIPNFRDDKEVMLHALQRVPSMFTYVSDRLKSDPDVILAAMDADNAYQLVCDTPAAVHREHPQIVIAAIERIQFGSAMRLLRTAILPELWQIVGVASAWIKRGFGVLEPFRDLVAHNRDLALLVAEFGWRDLGRSVPSSWLADADFMAAAIDRNGLVYTFAAKSLRNQLDLAVRAVANCSPESLSTLFAVDYTMEQKLAGYIQEKLHLHQLFVREFLRGIAVVQQHLPPPRRSALPMLDRGVETTQAFKLLIAAFLGVPIREELRRLRTAWGHLRRRRSERVASSATTATSSQRSATTAVYAARTEQPTVAFSNNSNRVPGVEAINNDDDQVGPSALDVAAPPEGGDAEWEVLRMPAAEDEVAEAAAAFVEDSAAATDDNGFDGHPFDFAWNRHLGRWMPQRPLPARPPLPERPTPQDRRHVMIPHPDFQERRFPRAPTGIRYRRNPRAPTGAVAVAARPSSPPARDNGGPDTAMLVDGWNNNNNNNENGRPLWQELDAFLGDHDDNGRLGVAELLEWRLGEEENPLFAMRHRHLRTVRNRIAMERQALFDRAHRHDHNAMFEERALPPPPPRLRGLQPLPPNLRDGTDGNHAAAAAAAEMRSGDILVRDHLRGANPSFAPTDNDNDVDSVVLVNPGDDTARTFLRLDDNETLVMMRIHPTRPDSASA